MTTLQPPFAGRSQIASSRDADTLALILECAGVQLVRDADGNAHLTRALKAWEFHRGDNRQAAGGDETKEAA